MGTEALMIQYTFRSGEEAIWYSVIMALETLSFAFQLGLYPSSLILILEIVIIIIII